MGRSYRLGKRAEGVSDTRQRIIDAARGLLLQPGSSGTGMNAVAKAAGVTRATVYQHFGSRGELLVAVVADTLERADVSRVIAALQDPDPRNALRRVLTEGCRIWAAERLTFAQIGSLGALDPGIAELNEQQERVKHMFLVPLVSRMEEQGLLRDGLSARDAALIVEAATRFESFDHLYTRNKLSLAKTTAMLVRIAEASILREPAAVPEMQPVVAGED